jgi:NAD+ diphosphatase
MRPTFKSAITPSGEARPTLWFLFQGYRLLVRKTEQAAQLPVAITPEALGLTPIRRQYMGMLDDPNGSFACYCGEVAEEAKPPAGFAFENLRPLYALLEETAFWLAGRAVQLVDWDRTHQYCGRCGSPTVNHEHERSKVCPNCGLTSYPRLAPAIIVRVQRLTDAGPEILLARAQRFPAAFFSVLAGFVEPGETLEECVAREIQEEVGITVKNIRYFGSQSWPFPHSLMIAFTADHEAGELIIDPLEIVEAGWFAPGALPTVPPPPSIANRLITSWLDEAK